MRYLVIIFLLVLLSSCSQRITDFTILSTKSIDLEDISKYEVAEGVRVEGIDSINILIVFPTGVANVKQAIDKAIEANPGCVGLVDGVIYNDWFYIPYLFGKNAYRVIATPLMKKGRTAKTNIVPKKKKTSKSSKKR